MAGFKVKWVANVHVNSLESERDEVGGWRVTSSQDLMDKYVVFESYQRRLPVQSVFDMLLSRTATAVGRIVKRGLIDAGLFADRDLKGMYCIVVSSTDDKDVTITLVDRGTMQPLFDLYVDKQIEYGIVNPIWNSLSKHDQEVIREYNDGLTWIPECATKEELFSWLLEYEGICGYDQWILERVSKIFGTPSGLIKRRK